MIRLRDVVEIETRPEQLFDWLVNLPENYLLWHPDHVACRYLRGAQMEEGSVLYVEEYLHGKLHKLRLHMTKVIPGRSMEYAIMPGMTGAFEVESRGGKTRFIATIAMGTDWPIVGTILDWVLRALFGRRIDNLAQHMAEEGDSLRALFGPVDSHKSIVPHDQRPQWD